MTQPPLDPERIADATARRLLERAIVLDTDGPTLDQLRVGAEEAGISSQAFDAAVAEWRGRRNAGASAPTSMRWTEAVVRNCAGMVLGWWTVALLAIPQRFASAPWLIHKLSDPVGLAIGAVIASRLRARTATVVLGGLAVSQGAEFLMDAFSGVPAIHGFGAHMALMIAGVAGVALGRLVWGRSTASKGQPDAFREDDRSEAAVNQRTKSPDAGLRNARADKRFKEVVRLCPVSYSIACGLAEM